MSDRRKILTHLSKAARGRFAHIQGVFVSWMSGQTNMTDAVTLNADKRLPFE